MLTLQSNTVKLPKESSDALKAALQSFAVRDVAQYPSSWGDVDLREDIKRLTPNWTGEALITGSSTQALMLSLEHVGHGKTLAVRVPCYFGVLRQAEKLGMKVKSWQTVEELEQLGAVDAVLLTSNLTPPSGHSLSDIDKQRIAAIARKHNAWVIEDNAYEPLWFESAPMPIPSDPARSIRIGSLSKIVSPDYRVGFIRAGNEALEAIRSNKVTGELSTPRLIQEIARAGITESLLTRWRDVLKSRAHVMQKALVNSFHVSVPMPEGGPFIELPLPEGTDIVSLVTKCKEKGLLIDDNQHQYPDGKNRSYLRLNCGSISEDDIPQAINILHQTFKEIYKPTMGKLAEGISANSIQGR